MAREGRGPVALKPHHPASHRRPGAVLAAGPRQGARLKPGSTAHRAAASSGDRPVHFMARYVAEIAQN